MSPEEAQISLGIASEAPSNPQPETYYTDLLRISNPTDSPIVVTSVAVSGVAESRGGDIGTVTVFYCNTQSDDPSSCGASYSVVAPSGGTVFSGGDTIAPGDTRFIELAGFAGPTAQPGDSISLVMQVNAE